MAFGLVQPQYGRVFKSFRNRGRNLDPQQYTKDQTQVKTEGSESVPVPKKTKLSLLIKSWQLERDFNWFVCFYRAGYFKTV